MPAERSTEAGFGLLEVIVCVALLTAGCVLTLALLPAVVRASQIGLVRGAATDVARNAIERVRAAGAYYPPAAMSDPSTRAAVTTNHAWALQPAAGYVAAARIEHALCGATGTTTDVALPVAIAYDALHDTLSVTVTYPPDPCVLAAMRSITLTAQLAPAAYAPQTQVPATIADPATQ
jgi:Tfp pilus assembly protein PilV